MRNALAHLQKAAAALGVVAALAALPLSAYAQAAAPTGSTPAPASAANSTHHSSLDETYCGSDGCTRTNQDGSVTSCSRPAGSNLTCTVTFPDKSSTKIVIGSFAGSNVQNFDASGKVIGTDNGADANAVTHQQTGQQNDANMTAAGQPTGACQLTSPSSWPDCLLKGTGTIVLLFTNTLLGIAGTFFNWVVVKTIFQFSTFIGNAPGLLTAWGIMRDLANILILFGFIVIGFGTILDIDKMPNKKMLPGLIIFAVLLNFSLFASEAVIDISNVLSATMYQQANTDPCTSITGASNDFTNCAINVGLAGGILKATGLSSMMSTKNPGAGLTFALVMSLVLFSLVGAIVLFAAGMMILIRAIILTFLMLTSPIAFAGLVVPTLQKSAKNWWNTLLREAFFAPIVILLMLISLKISDGFMAQANGQNASILDALSSQNASSMGVFLVYFAVIGFMIASLVVAKQFGAAGSDWAIKTSGRMVGGATFGSAGFVGRRTIGYGASKAADAVRKTDFGQSEMGRGFAQFLDKRATATYDVRGSLNKAIKGTPAGKAGLTLGEVDKKSAAAKGYKGIVEAEVKKRTEYAKSLKGKESESQKEEMKRLDDERTRTEQKFKDDKAQNKKDLEAAKKSRDNVDQDIEKEKADATKKRDEEKGKLQEQKAEIEARIKAAQDAGTPENQAKLRSDLAAARLQAADSNADIPTRAVAQRRAAELEKELAGASAGPSEEDTKKLGEIDAALEKADADHAARMTELEQAAPRMREERNKAVETLTNASIQLDKDQKAAFEDIDKQRKGATAQGNYANNIEKGRKWPLTLAKTVNEKSAKDIRDSIKLSKAEKSLDAIKGALEKAGVENPQEQAEAAVAAAEEAVENKEEE